MPLRFSTTVAIAALVAGSQAVAQSGPVDQGDKNVPEFTPAFDGQTRIAAASSGVSLAEEVIAGNLEHPWGMALLPDGNLLVTERPGRMRVVSPDGTVSEPISGLPDVASGDQGGLLDVALSPDFASDRMIYWTYAKPLDDGNTATAAGRGVLSDDMSAVENAADIWVQSPGSPSPMHYGSRIVFSADGTAFVTTGEHFTDEERVFAQDLDKTYGKVIRINSDGSVPEDNPFVAQDGADTSIWSYGHRNVQGAAIGPDGTLWTIEHGPQGGDELNRPEAGKNYGWPVISYGENYDGTPIGSGQSAQDGMEQPVYYWDPVIAPGGMAFYQGALFPEWEGDLLVSSLQPGALVRLELTDGKVTGEEEFLADRGSRIRDVEVAADGAILVLTDAEDGEVLRLVPGEAPETD